MRYTITIVSRPSPFDILIPQDGVRRGVDSFYRHLPLLNMRYADENFDG